LIGWARLLFLACIFFGRPGYAAGLLDVDGNTPAALTDPEGNFRIRDYQVHSYRDRGLYLNGNGTVGGSDQAYWDPLGVDHRQIDSPSAVVNLQPLLEVTSVSVPQDLSYNWPLALIWSQADSAYDHDVLAGATDNHTTVDMENSLGEATLSPSGSSIWYFGRYQAGLVGSMVLDAKHSLLQSESTTASTPFGSATAFYSGSQASEIENYSASGHVEFRFGVGRSVESRWAWNAIQLARDLSEVGSLLKPMTAEDLQELSGKMSEVGQAFPWDFRSKKRADTKMICDFLVEHDYIKVDDANAVDTVSDVYLDGNLSRPSGAYAVVLGEMQAGIAHGEITGHQTINGVYSNTVLYDQQHDFVNKPAPGAGLLAGFFRPLNTEWQANFTGRFDYLPFYRLEGPTSSNQSRHAVGSLGGSVDYAPSTRVTLTLANQASAGSMHVEIQDQQPGPWTPLSTYDDLTVSDTLSLTYSCQLTYYVVGSLSGSLNYLYEARDNPWARTLSTGPATDAFEAQYDQPFNSQWTPALNFNLAYRFI
jgi:hypothetical protein